jgi:hypothetical protein
MLTHFEVIQTNINQFIIATRPIAAFNVQNQIFITNVNQGSPNDYMIMTPYNYAG